MKNVSAVLVVLMLAGFALQVERFAVEGRSLREAERQAARDLVEIMVAEEEHRLGQTNGDSLYASLPQLIATGRIRGFDSLADRSGNTFHRKGHYLFALSLGDDSGRRADSSAATPVNCTRFDLWAWPASEHALASVEYFASNAGYLIQIENGEHAGVEQPPSFEDNPLREMQRSSDRPQSLPTHQVLLQIRSSHSRWPPWITMSSR